MSTLSRQLLILAGTAWMLAFAAFAAFGLWFAPGWSNGWPLQENIVWPLGLSAVAFAGGLILLGGLGLTFNPAEGSTESPRLSTKTLVALSLGIASIAALTVFFILRPQAVAMWP